jgi:hypothetical protein
MANKRMAYKRRNAKPQLLCNLFYIIMQMWLICKFAHNLVNMKQAPNPISLAEACNIDATSSKLPAASSIWFLKKSRLSNNISNTDPKKHATYMLLSILLLSGDVELNPGPNNSTIYLCPFCDVDVKYGMKALQCEDCDMWYHKTCVSMCTQDYRNLENNSISFICCRCDHPNHTSSLLDHEIQTYNSFESLDISNTETVLHIDGETNHFIPRAHSSPNKEIINQIQKPDLEGKHSSSNKEIINQLQKPDLEGKLPQKGKNWRSLVVNANWLEGKIAETNWLISHTNPDLLLITETKLGDDCKKAVINLNKMGYKPYRKDREKGGGGTIIAIKKCYNHDEIELTDNPDSEIKFIDYPGVVQWVEVSLNNKKKMYVGVFYRQPDHKTEQLKCLENSLKIIKNKMKTNPNSILILGGDFNAGDIDWENHLINKNNKMPVHEELLKIIADNDLTQHQMEPTRLGRTLDLFLTNCPNIVQNMHTLPGISDHDIPVADCNINPSYNKKQPRKLFNFRKANWEKMRQETKSFSEQFIKEHKERSVEQNWKELKKYLMKIMDKYVPSKSTSIRHNLLWMNTTLKRMVRKKQRLYNKAKKSHKRKDWDEYNKHKKETLKSMKKSRWNYINKILIDGMKNDNNKPFWRFVKSQQKEDIGVAPLKTDHPDLAKDSKEKAEILNRQFQSVFTQDDGKGIPAMDGPDYPQINDLKIINKGVVKLLQNLKVNKAPGPDDLPAYILKELADEVAPILTAIFTQSLQQGSLPRDWLKANVAPIFKKGNKNLAVNYRPVSLTCICCKVMEHIICKHMLNHLDMHKILTALQHGFRNGYSCETQLLVTLHDLMKNRDNKIQTDVAILDFSKAFDTVPHDKLLHKLKHYGITGEILEWISVFLKTREQRVVVDGKGSSWVHVDSGVPQGTVLGPLLFLLFINDLPECISNESTVRLFADDCIMYRKIKTFQDQIDFQRDLDKLKEWADKWGMKFNASKCEVMRIDHSQTTLHMYYNINGQVLKQANKTKYLGIMISEDLSWSPHVQYVTGKANKVLGIIRRNFKECPQELREIAYFSMVRSILDYASAIWDPHLQKNITKLDQVQRRAARFVKHEYRIYNKEEQQYNSVTNMIKELGWKDLADRRRDIRLSLLYKIINEDVNICTKDTLIPARGRTRKSQQSNKFMNIQTVTDDYKHSFYPRTVPEWNSLPTSTVNAPSIETFNRHLKAKPPTRD